MTNIRGDDLIAIGLKPGPVFGVALNALPKAVKRLGRERALAELAATIANPSAHVSHEYFDAVAKRLIAVEEQAAVEFVERDGPAPFASWCLDAEPGALAQMQNAMRIPSAIVGALMPDAHLGYGLPIGGVMATDGTVIPYAVGVDIACRMKLSVIDLPATLIDSNPDLLERALLSETAFGVGATLARKADGDVLDTDRWSTPLLRSLRQKAAAQLGSSGSGNHFVEFGTLSLPEGDLGLPAGEYLAILSHSGSRGTGAKIADHYSKLARARHPELPKELSFLSWLELGHETGAEYWHAMNLMGDYASRNHGVIHERLTEALSTSVLAGVENHHNFAWSERHEGRELIVHRKGATPAGDGVLGMIPGTMATPGFVVRGRGVASSLNSASHGAGRAMSRTRSRNEFTWHQIRPMLEAAGVRLLSAGIDENPRSYKDIEQVMAAQADLVQTVGRFDPRIVRMADAGERPED
jgi:tRNA-splicing ligase RtcB (3'-phosphate/5'-hydroxy nucleic acid ligase)